MRRQRPWEAAYPEALQNYRLDLSALPAHPADFCGEAARAFGDRPAFSMISPAGDHGTLTFDDVDRLSDVFARFLGETLKLAPGEVIAIQLPNCLHYPVTVFGAWKAGLIATLVNPSYTPVEVERQLADSDAKAVVACDLFLGSSEGAVAALQIPRIVASLDDFSGAMPPRGSAAPDDATDGSSRPGEWKFLETLSTVTGRPTAARHEVVLYQYTGGTTGRSKAAIISGNNIRAALTMLADFFGAYGRPFDGGTPLLVLPLYHIFSFTLGFLLHFRAGSHAILVPNPRPLRNLQPAFDTYPINWMAGVDTLYAGLLREPWFRARPPRLDYAITGGAAIRPTTAREWEEAISPMIEGYGLTETTGIVCSNPPTGARRFGTVALPMPGCDVMIVDDQGAECAQGEAGELVVRGPQVVRAYRNAFEDQQAAFRDGWFHTGDMARMHPDGYVEIVDRKKDMILVSGLNVYPNEVEAVIAAHPSVVEAAVVGIADDRTGQSVKAFVVVKDGDLGVDVLIAYCRTALAAYKVPKQVVFLPALPKSPIGKIQRAQLRAGS